MNIFLVPSFIFLSFAGAVTKEEHPLLGEPFRNNSFADVDPDMTRSTFQLILSKGYPAEIYDVQTKDGYILTIQRIPNGRKNQNGEKNQKKEVAFLQHGLLSSSADWVMNFPNESLGFVLADAGYDVWLGNVRGNTYARRHVKYSTGSEEFWKFSFDEMALYDLPAMIDFILERTRQEKLYYIGHSQGTLVAFALLSEKVEYNDKIKLFMALGPIATVGHITSPIRLLAPFAKEMEFFFYMFGVGEFLPSDQGLKILNERVCDTERVFLCKSVLFLVCGADSSRMNETRLHVYAAHSPAGTSTQNMIHFAQMVRSKKFQKFDHGRKSNFIHYKQGTPPVYKVEKVTAPVALFWSRDDILADPTDVRLLQTKLTNLAESHLVELPQFSHLDFIYGVKGVDILYDEIFKLMRKF